MTGWGEAGFMERFGVPAVYFGPGDPKFSHTPEERCLTARIREAEAVFFASAKAPFFPGGNFSACAAPPPHGRRRRPRRSGQDR